MNSGRGGEDLGSGAPTVSVGLPVYNGENYVDEAIASVVGQTMTDWELIIGDNASTDNTPQICQSWTERDERIRFFRHSENQGAAFNYNVVLSKAGGRYLKWSAHGDVCGPAFLEVCVAALERDPDVVLAYPSPIDIDSKSEVIGPCDAGLVFTYERPSARLRAVTGQPHACLPIFGVFRAGLFEAGVRHGNYPSPDQVILAEVALHGKLVEVPQQEFFHREHQARYVHTHSTAMERAKWFDTRRAGKSGFPLWRPLGGYLQAIQRVPMPLSERLRCGYHILKWTVGMGGRLANELLPQRQV